MTTAAGRVRTFRSVLGRMLPMAGIDVARVRRTVSGAPRFIGQYCEYRAQSRGAGLEPPALCDLFPVIGEDAESAGGYDPHYLHQDLWAARRLYESAPALHYDVSSRVDGFVTSALVFCPVVMVDVRPFPVSLPNLSFQQTDATRLPFDDSSIESISSLHAMEHFGLGRYGDRLNPTGTVDALGELARVIAPGGRVYVGLPVGRPRVMFNAHRVLSPSAVLAAMKPLRLVGFAAVDDRGEFVAEANPSDFEDTNFACGLFELTKD